MNHKLTKAQIEQEELFRTARTTGSYDNIWQTVGRCVFCDHISRHVVYEENEMILFVPAYAYIDGHLLVAPKKHITSIKQLTSDQWETMRKMFYIAKKLIREVHAIKGMQIIQKDGRDAQSTVEHLHIHCVPFDAPDLSQWNYRDLKLTPYENAAAYRKYSEKITKLSKRFEKKHADN